MRQSNVLRLYPEFGTRTDLWTEFGSIDISELDLSPDLTSGLRAWVTFWDERASSTQESFGELPALRAAR